jgi:hypothetical protein
MSTHGRFATRDVVLSLLLLVGIVAYLAYLPRSLGRADESHFLYEAKRIRDGEVMYRDFFQFVTPGASYTMAALFWAFGTTIATARIATAVLHALTGVVMYATGRALGVRSALALLPPLAYIALCQSAWQFASWHWFSTFFVTLIVFTLVRGPWASRPRWALVPGLVTGVLIGVQQQKGLATAAGIVALFVADHLVDRRYPNPEPLRCLAVRLFCFAAGAALIVVPLLATFALLAGVPPLYEALVRFPLVHYRKSFRAEWGAVFAITRGYASYTFPVLLKYLPVVLLPACVRVFWHLYAGTGRAQLRAMLVLICSAAASVLSIWYFPGFVHIAFIAPVFFIAAAEAMEWLLGAAVRPARLRVAAGWVLAVVLAGLLALHLRGNAITSTEQFRYGHETAFGRIDFKDRWEGVLIDKTRELLGATASHELFAYPNTSHPYLTTGARNPTPFQYLYAPVSPREHVERVIEILETRDIPYVMRQGFYAGPNDPIAKVLDKHYEPVWIPELAALGEFPTLKLYRRKSAPADRGESAN